MKTKFIINAVKAYINSEYKGNLIDLMSIHSAYDREEKHSFEKDDYFDVDKIIQF